MVGQGGRYWYGLVLVLLKLSKFWVSLSFLGAGVGLNARLGGARVVFAVCARVHSLGSTNEKRLLVCW